MRLLLPQGAEVVDSGVRYRYWAPEHTDLAVEIFDAGTGALQRVVNLVRDALDCHHAVDSEGRAGDLYKVRLSNRKSYPCPASRWQPHGVDGASMVIDTTDSAWSDQD